MLFSLVLAVIISAFFMLFSTEFIGLLKKILAIRGMNLLLPLTLVTAFLVSFEPAVLAVLLYVQASLITAATFLANYLPFGPRSLTLVEILLLASLSFLPVLALDLLKRRNSYQGYQYPILTSTLIWIFVSILLVVRW